jgi:CMP-N,N'-diacetyllegionaminic acid synthase
MINSKRVLALVPARSGSKGIPGKNKKLINNIPLLAYPIIAADKSKYIDKIIFSSDDQEMCDIAQSYGAEVPFLRPIEFATDDSVRADTILHALNYVHANFKEKFDILIFLEPTSPLTNENDIDTALEFFFTHKCQSLVSIMESPTHHPEYAVELDNFTKKIKPFLRKSFSDLPMNRQALKPVYFFDGSLYISDIPTFLKYKEFYHEKTKGIIFDALKSLEIDEPIDFLLAEFLSKNKDLKN